MISSFEIILAILIGSILIFVFAYVYYGKHNEVSSTNKDSYYHSTISNVIKKNEHLLTLTSNTTIPTALVKLSKTKFSSAPVFNPNTNKWIGSIDMLDLVGIFSTLSRAKEFAELFAKRDIPWWEFLEQENNVVSQQTIEGLLNISEHNLWIPIQSNESIQQALTLFKRDADIHRLPVFENQKLVYVLSHIDILLFLAKNVKHIKQAELKIGDLFKRQPVYTISPNEKTIVGFNLMIEKKVNAIAVVDKNGAISSVVSSSDLKRSKQKNIFTDLNLPISSYLELKNSSFPYSKQAPIFVTPFNSLHDALAMFEKNTFAQIVCDRRAKSYSNRNHKST